MLFRVNKDKVLASDCDMNADVAAEKVVYTMCFRGGVMSALGQVLIPPISLRLGYRRGSVVTSESGWARTQPTGLGRGIHYGNVSLLAFGSV